MKKLCLLIMSGVFALLLFSSAPVLAHFGTIIPSDDIVSQDNNKTINIEVKFLHPMEGNYMDMVKPKQFAVIHSGHKIDLLSSLQPQKGKSAEQVVNHDFWKADYKIKRPGDYTFYVEPVPYWEPAEDSYIVHYTKVCVNALGLEEGWDEPVGLETEIIPLTRPYGLWTNNVFTGKVLVNEKPAVNIDVEIEYLNETKGNISQINPPSDPYITQVVKTDSNGIFTYAMPKAGWWGFAALSEASWKLKRGGQEKGVEIGAVYWVKTIDMR